MENANLNLMKNEIEELVISEIESKTKLVLTKEDFKLNLKTNNDEISGDVYLFDEYYENFRVKIPREGIKERICELIFVVISEFGDLKDVLVSGKRNNLESELNETTSRILTLIQSRKEVKELLGDITIMVDEQYPYEEFYENHFPVWQYEIRDTTQKLNIVEKLDFELSNFDEEKILNQVAKELKEILKKE